MRGDPGYPGAVPLQRIDLQTDPAPLPPKAAAFLLAVQARIDAFFDAPGTVQGLGFVPSDYEPVFRALRALRKQVPEAHRFCEWGSGFGMVTGFAALLGFEAHGIEIDAALVDTARALLAEHGLRASVVHGSFVPDDPEVRERLDDPDGRTVLSGASAYDDMDLAPEDFDVVFAYPWPSEELRYRELFHRCADYGAVLMTYSATDGVRAFRKVGRQRGRR